MLVCIILCVAVYSSAQANVVPAEISLTEETQQIKLDGYLTESGWDTAGTIADLEQQDPRPGAPTPYHTRIRFLRHGTWLYIGVEADFPNGEGVRVHSHEHDADLTVDDAVTVVLDTFANGRTAYLFRFNAAGARQDGLITPSAKDPDYGWDGRWDVQTRIAKARWTAEVAIDLRALHFAANGTAWGLNVERFVAAGKITLRWQGTSADATLTDLSRAGRLTGVEGIAQGLGIGVVPYTLARGRYTAGRSSSLSGAAGGEFSYNINPELGGTLSVNTDFAETEVDDQQINLTRFPLLFPEKRAFFLDGSNQFDFAPGLSKTFIPFFSRRVGLVDGTVVPIDIGAKVLGRVGNLSFGAVDAQMRTSPAAPAVNLLATRVTYDWDSNLRLGTLFTHGDPHGAEPNSLLAWDLLWRTSHFTGDKNLQVSAWSAESTATALHGNRRGDGARIAYPNDLWDWALQFDEFGVALDPGLGFLPRPGTRQYVAEFAYSPRPSSPNLAFIRQEHFEVFPQLVTDYSGRALSWLVFIAPLNFDLANGDLVQFIYQPEYERPLVPFSIANNVTVRAGAYRFDTRAIQYQTSTSRWWSASLIASTGSYYDGRLTSWQPGASFAFRDGHLALSLSNEIDEGILGGVRFNLRLWKMRLSYAPNSNVAISTLAQYDSVAGQAGINTRITWTLSPGHDLFVVWTRNYTDPTEAGFRGLQRQADEIIVKMKWDLRI